MSSNILELDLFENETLKKQKKNIIPSINFMYKILRIIIHIDERVKG